MVHGSVMPMTHATQIRPFGSPRSPLQGKHFEIIFMERVSPNIGKKRPVYFAVPVEHPSRRPVIRIGVW